MITFESRVGRRLLVRVDPDEELISALESWAVKQGVESGVFRGSGTLKSFELAAGDNNARRSDSSRAHEVPADLLSLDGSFSLVAGQVRVSAVVTLGRHAKGGAVLLGGRLLSARVHSVELWVQTFDDLRLERQPDPETGLLLLQNSESAQAPERRQSLDKRQSPANRQTPAPMAASRKPAPLHDPSPVPQEQESAPKISWADVAAVSAAPSVEHSPEPRPSPSRRRPSESPRRSLSEGAAGSHDQSRPEQSRPERSRPAQGRPVATRPAPSRGRQEQQSSPPTPAGPKKGDWVEHRQFGLCKVDKQGPDTAIVIRLPSGIRKTIRLDYMDVGRSRREGTRRIFPLQAKRR